MVRQLLWQVDSLLARELARELGRELPRELARELARELTRELTRELRRELTEELTRGAKSFFQVTGKGKTPHAKREKGRWPTPHKSSGNDLKYTAHAHARTKRFPGWVGVLVGHLTSVSIWWNCCVFCYAAPVELLTACAKSYIRPWCIFHYADLGRRYMVPGTW